jgi:hypothetical protein
MLGRRCSTRRKDFASRRTAVCWINVIMTRVSHIFTSICLKSKLKGPSTRVQTRVQITVRFCAQFAAKELWVLYIYHTHITTVAIHLWHQIVHRIVCRFVREFVRVDGPLDNNFLPAMPDGFNPVGSPLTISVATSTNTRMFHKLSVDEELYLMPGQYLGISGVEIQKM